MHYSRLALAAAPALFVSVSAYGNCIIQNDCTFDVYFWEDAGQGPSRQTITAGNHYSKEMYQTGKGNGAGPSYKLARDPNTDPYGGAITQYEYTVNAPGWPNQASFDISNVDAHGAPPFKDFGLHAFAVQEPSKTKTCDAGSVKCMHNGELNGYEVFNDDAKAMVQTAMNNDIQLTICSGNSGSGGGSSGSGNSGNSGNSNSNPAPVSSSPSPPPPPPSTTSAAPVASTSSTPSTNNNQVKAENHQAVQSPVSSKPISSTPPAQAGGETVIVTQTFTAPVVIETVHQVVDVNKREEHVHAHAHAHNKINKRRHGN